MSEIDFNPFEVIEAITPKVTLGRKEYVAGRICFTLMFFIPPDGTFSIPTRMVEALARVRRDFPLDLYDCWDTEAPKRPAEFSELSPPNLDQALEQFMKENDTEYTGAFWGQYWSGKRDGKAPVTQFVAWYYDRVLERESHNDLDESNTFQVNIPLTLLDSTNRPQLLQKLFVDLCTILQPLSALGGLCMAAPLDITLLQAQQEQDAILPLLTNSPGLLFDTAFNMTAHTRWRMSAVNWLTAIRGDLLERCGGPEAVLAKLSRPGFETAQYGESGLFVQAGSSPQLGNLKAELTLPHYGDLARALEPARLRIQGGRRPHVAYYGPEDTLYSETLMAEVQNAWLARFDEMR